MSFIILLQKQTSPKNGGFFSFIVDMAIQKQMKHNSAPGMLKYVMSMAISIRNE